MCGWVVVVVVVGWRWRVGTVRPWRWREWWGGEGRARWWRARWEGWRVGVLAFQRVLLLLAIALTLLRSNGHVLLGCGLHTPAVDEPGQQGAQRDGGGGNAQPLGHILAFLKIKGLADAVHTVLHAVLHAVQPALDPAAGVVVAVVVVLLFMLLPMLVPLLPMLVPLISTVLTGVVVVPVTMLVAALAVVVVVRRVPRKGPVRAGLAGGMAGRRRAGLALWVAGRRRQARPLLASRAGWRRAQLQARGTSGGRAGLVARGAVRRMVVLPFMLFAVVVMLALGERKIALLASHISHLS